MVKLPEGREPLLWKDIPFSERPKTHPSSWEGEAKISRITISRLEARVAELEVALGRLVTAVEDGCFCSEMEMATRIDEARAAQHIEPEEPMKRTPRALTHEIRWLLGLGFVACIAGMMGLWLITRGMW